jgi:hypothetical protein
MPESMIVFKKIIEESWSFMSSIEVLDLGFSFAELMLGILFFLLLVNVLKLLIFGGFSSTNSVVSDLKALEAERIAAENETAISRMYTDRAKAREDVNNLRAAKNFYNPKTNPQMHGPPAPKDLSSLNPQKSK